MKNINELDINVTSDIRESVLEVLSINDLNIVLEHTKSVEEYAVSLAYKYNYSKQAASIAALLHDIGGIIPSSKRIVFCNNENINYIKEEEEFPILLHQRLSRVIAKEIYQIKNKEILSAINCHTTLKANPGKLDLILFIADKIKWDQEGKPPYEELMLKGLNHSLEMSAYNYIKYVVDNNKLKVAHPDLIEAKEYLESYLGKEINYA